MGENADSRTDTSGLFVPFPRLDKLLATVDQAVVSRLVHICKRPGGGLVLVSGFGSQSGKTRTSLSLVQEYKIVHGDSATLNDERYVFFGEVRDPRGAIDALRLAVSGKVVVATYGAGTLPEALQFMLKLVSAGFGPRLEMDAAREMMADGLAAVLQQSVRFDDGKGRIVLDAIFMGDPSTEEGIAARAKMIAGDLSGLVRLSRA